jgi:hypothetical protein
MDKEVFLDNFFRRSSLKINLYFIIKLMKNFLEWFCFDISKQLENRFQQAMFLGLLQKCSTVILEMIDETIYKKISQYKNETEDIDFFPSDSMELSDEILSVLKKHFLSEERV